MISLTNGKKLSKKKGKIRDLKAQSLLCCIFDTFEQKVLVGAASLSTAKKQDRGGYLQLWTGATCGKSNEHKIQTGKGYGPNVSRGVDALAFNEKL